MVNRRRHIIYYQPCIFNTKILAGCSVFKDIADQKETLWVNSKLLPFDMVDAVCQLVVSDEDIADASALDGELAVVETGDTGVRTPVIAAASAFGEVSDNTDASSVPDIKALEEHTGVDASRCC